MPGWWPSSAPSFNSCGDSIGKTTANRATVPRARAQPVVPGRLLSAVLSPPQSPCPVADRALSPSLRGAWPSRQKGCHERRPQGLHPGVGRAAGPGPLGGGHAEQGTSCRSGGSCGAPSGVLLAQPGQRCEEGSAQVQGVGQVGRRGPGGSQRPAGHFAGQPPLSCCGCAEHWGKATAQWPRWPASALP